MRISSSPHPYRPGRVLAAVLALALTLALVLTLALADTAAAQVSANNGPGSGGRSGSTSSSGATSDTQALGGGGHSAAMAHNAVRLTQEAESLAADHQDTLRGLRGTLPDDAGSLSPRQWAHALGGGAPTVLSRPGQAAATPKGAATTTGPLSAADRQRLDAARPDTGLPAPKALGAGP